MILLLLTACDDGGCERAWRFVDADGDGFGAGHAAVMCVTEGSDRDDDCDDTVAGIHPGAAETCDQQDQDCDGVADDDAPDSLGWYPDLDDDGFGHPDDVRYSCTPIQGRVADATDCDDRYITVHPGAAELCNLRDDDCDGELDEDAINPTTVYVDADGDGAGDPNGETSVGCPGIGGWGSPNDCDDDDPSRHPGAAEHCDGVDEDCDSVADEDSVDALDWPLDADDDGYGSPTETVRGCGPPPNGAENADDCDDADPAFHPGAEEVCSPAAEDEDCDGLVDAEEITTLQTWFADADGDGYGDAALSVEAPCPPEGWADNGEDCDDADADTHPFAPESGADALDHNCDGHTGAEDSDADGFEADHDCDDNDPAAHPGAEEVADGGDDDCDGLIDEYVGDVDFRTIGETRAFCAVYGAVEGSVVVSGVGSLRGLACLRAISGDLRLVELGASSLGGIEALLRVGGDVSVEAGVAQDLTFPMRTVGGDVSVDRALLLTSIGAPHLDALGGGVTLRGLAFGSGFRLDWPGPIPGTLTLGGFSGGDLSGATLPATVGGLRVVSADAATLVGLDDVTLVTGDVIWAASSGLLEVSGLAGLREIAGTLRIADNPALTTLDLPALTRVGGDLLIDHNASLGQDVAEAWAAALDVGGDTIVRRNN